VGHDVVYVDGAAKFTCGELGCDSLFQQLGCDSLFQQLGCDSLFQQLGCDSLFQQLGCDLLFQQLGCDSLFQQLGCDLLFQQLGCDSLFRQLGCDSLFQQSVQDKKKILRKKVITKFSAVKFRSTNTLKCILAHNAQTEFKEGDSVKEYCAAPRKIQNFTTINKDLNLMKVFLYTVLKFI
jgi:hypothetical protein